MNHSNVVAIGPVVALCVIALCASPGCSDTNASPSDRAHASASPPKDSRVGILLVSHGSHSPAWRKMLEEFHDAVAPRLREISGVGEVKSAFMEYTEPSIASTLKEFDREGYADVILLPLLLTVSSHSFDDIPTIAGIRDDANTALRLKSEGIECYNPTATITVAPLLDFSQLLESNLPRRVAALSREPAGEGVVLVAYGDITFDAEWQAFFSRLGSAVKRATGVAEVVHAWCGHVVHYSKQPTQDAIRKILAKHQRAIVVPVLVARDERFQDALIGEAIAELGRGDAIAYVPDAILPDPTLEEWVISVTRKTLNEIRPTTSP